MWRRVPFRIVLISVDIHVHQAAAAEVLYFLVSLHSKNEAFESRIPATETLAKLIKECFLKKFAHFSMDGEQKFVCLFKDR